MDNQPDTKSPVATSRPVTGPVRTLVISLDRLIFQLAKHWLLVFNIVSGIYAGLPLLAPVFMACGLTSWGKAIYTLYIPACHQLPWRSFFLFGAQPTYSYQALRQALGPGGLSTLWEARKFYGTPTLGYKMAYCERDAAIYTSIFLGGLIFALLRHRLKPLPWTLFFLSILPLAVDGLGQMLGFWESTPLSRLITGGLFGFSAVWLTYPYLEEGMNDVRRTLSARFGWR
ncbi:MAG: DUF2085 domain-containing protein [Anaerolineae bacterium]|nr:DUF2085 domain-containing protein [Anaerolineae bacterium]